MGDKYDHRKGSYAAALSAWKSASESVRENYPRPNPQAFGLTEEEGAEVARDGYPTGGLPTPLRPKAMFP